MFLYTLILIAAAGACLGLAAFSWFRRDVPGARYFILGNFFLLFYIVGTIFEIRAQTPEQIQACLALEYVGIATVGPFWVLVTWGASMGKRDWSNSALFFFFALPIGIILAVATNDLHHLFYSSVGVRQNGEFSVPVLGKGPLYLINLVYMNLTLFFGTLLILSRLFRAPRAYRNQLLLLLLASLFPWGGMLLYQTGLSPWGLDIAPLGLTMSCLIFGYALFRFQLFDLSPLLIDRVLECMHEGVLVLDTKKRLVGLNPALQAMVPSLDYTVLGSPLTQLGEPITALSRLLEQPEGNQITWRERHYQVDQAELKDRRGSWRGTIVLFTDVTERVNLTNRLFEVSRTDELTEIPNRRSFLETARRQLSRLKRGEGPLSLIILDIDHFKAINDTWGHQAGDQALIHVVQTCALTLRPSDHLTRYGGEEFAVLLPGLDPAATRQVAQRMRLALERSAFSWQGLAQPLTITASFGCASLQPEDLDSPALRELSLELLVDLFVKRADDAMYRAKAQGRNCIAEHASLSS